MSYQSVTNKIRCEHLGRYAYVYVRQSTLQQIRENTISTLRQYDLAKFAAELGWAQDQIIVVDQDQARSGASTEGRDGFKRMLSEIALGNVGAVISLEASRLARDSSAWHQLLKICEVTNTLVIDEIGIYDPRDRDDRLLLGFKGTMSEAELNLLVGRLMGAKRRMAGEGKLRFPLPVGFVSNSDGTIVLDPDEEIQHSIRLLFDSFDKFSSARMMVRDFNDKGLLFPSKPFGKVKGGQIEWVPLRYNRALWVLAHPAYAGVYAYGRTKSYKHISLESYAEVIKRVKKVDMAEWEVAIFDNHVGYITWEKYLHNQKRLSDNRNRRSEDKPGAIRAGAALLQGIMRCGVCGRRVQVKYPKGKKHPIYFCGSIRIEYASPSYCLSFSGELVDKAVADVFLEAIKPAQLQLSIGAVERLETEMRQVNRQLELQIEKACYEADLARRRFTAVDPENRLVGRNLEREWNDLLAEVDRLKREQSTKVSLKVIGSSERQAILNLSRDLPKIWHAASTTQIDRKQLLRYIIRDVTVTRDNRIVRVGICWQTGVYTQLMVTLNTTGESLQTDSNTLALIRELAADYTNVGIAEHLNKLGILSRTGRKYNRHMISALRREYGMPRSKPRPPLPDLREDGRYSVKKAAEILNVSKDAIAKWWKKGRIDGVQSKPGGYVWIKLTPEKVTELKRA
jgi:DNA invertase Pin-like site-specific DNA recombinase